MPKRPFRNRLNDLTPTEWLKFQKSWFIHNPPPRRKEVLKHPGKFPESMVQDFIQFFTKQGQTVLDPMAGTGSTLVAALRAKRHAYGVELNPEYADLARQVITRESDLLGKEATGLEAEIITGDAANVSSFFEIGLIPRINYLITSPPYWNMLHAKGAETQRTRRQAEELDVYYSDDPGDLGNIDDYEQFVERLIQIYVGLKPVLENGAYLTIIVKNIKKKGRIYPLAWDLGSALKDTYSLKDEKIWCQDDQRLAPYGIGNAWVSNTFHHYCLQFRNDI